MDLDWFWKCLFLQFISIANTMPIKYSFFTTTKDKQTEWCHPKFQVP
jgi:hypothetical protein